MKTFNRIPEKWDILERLSALISENCKKNKEKDLVLQNDRAKTVKGTMILIIRLKKASSLDSIYSERILGFVQFFDDQEQKWKI